MIGGQATRTCTSRARPRSRNCEISVFMVVDRTIVSSTSSTRFPSRTSGSGVYLSRALSARFVPSINVRPT